MKQKYLLLIVGVVVLIGAGLFLSLRNDSSKPAPTSESATQSLEDKQVWADFDARQRDSNFIDTTLKRLQLTVPEANQEVTLENGQATISGGFVKLGPVLGKVKTADNNYDLFADLAVNFGGSGVFHYVTLFAFSPDTVYNTSSSKSVGDRIILKSITPSATGKNDYMITVNYLDRGANDPMVVDPTIPKTTTFKVSDHKIL